MTATERYLRLHSKTSQQKATPGTAESFSEVVQQAVEWTGMEQAPLEDRTRLLTDRDSGYLARAFEDYLRELKIRHIYCAPYHP